MELQRRRCERKVRGRGCRDQGNKCCCSSQRGYLKARDSFAHCSANACCSLRWASYQRCRIGRCNVGLSRLRKRVDMTPIETCNVVIRCALRGTLHACERAIACTIIDARTATERH